jgi:xanthosine utilization system XapX-like protein
LAKTVEEVEHGIALGIFGVIVGRQLHAVVNRLFENAAVDDVTVSTALRMGQVREEDENE